MKLYRCDLSKLELQRFNPQNLMISNYFYCSFVWST